LQNDAAGVLFRINVGNKAALLLDADYLSTKPEFQDFDFSEKIGLLKQARPGTEKTKYCIFAQWIKLVK